MKNLSRLPVHHLVKRTAFEWEGTSMLHPNFKGETPFRCETRSPMTGAQLLVMDLLARLVPQKEIAKMLDVSESTITQHVLRGAEKIPGDLPPAVKCVMWYRGATLDVLIGSRLKMLAPLAHKKRQRVPPEVAIDPDQRWKLEREERGKARERQAREIEVEREQKLNYRAARK